MTHWDEAQTQEGGGGTGRFNAHDPQLHTANKEILRVGLISVDLPHLFSELFWGIFSLY